MARFFSRRHEESRFERFLQFGNDAAIIMDKDLAKRSCEKTGETASLSIKEAVSPAPFPKKSDPESENRVKAIPHNSAAISAANFAQSAACKNLDLRPVNLRKHPSVHIICFGKIV